MADLIRHEGRVEANGLRLYYRRWGRGPRLMVLHGLSDWGLDWTRVATPLALSREVILPDQRGHGLSDKPAEGYAFADFAADAGAMIQALDLHDLTLMGHSLGGAAALGAAVAVPDRISRLVLVDPAIFMAQRASPHLDPTPEERRRNYVEWISVGREGLAARCRRESPRWLDEDIEPWAEAKLLMSPDVQAGLKRFDPDEQIGMLESLRCPTLIIRGDSSGIIMDDANLTEIKRHVPSVQVATIRDSGHCPQRDNYAGFTSALGAFLPWSATSSAPRDR